VRAAEEVVRRMTSPVELRMLLRIQYSCAQRLLKLYKSVLVALTGLIAQAIFRSQAHCFQRVFRTAP
jgi:hypothetical protein